MSQTIEDQREFWDNDIARHECIIAEHESQIARIKAWWDSEPRAEAFNSQILHLQEKIGVQKICLDASREKRRSLEEG